MSEKEILEKEQAQKPIDEFVKDEDLSKVSGGDGEGVYKCLICGISFAYPYNYQTHMKMHWHEK